MPPRPRSRRRPKRVRRMPCTRPTARAIDRHDAAEAFRADLLTAGIDRVELHDTSSPFRRPVRLHDLRASMVTSPWRTAGPRNGSAAGPATRRAPSNATAGVAATLRELTLGDWKPLDEAIPELVVAAAKGGFSGSSPRKSDPRDRRFLSDPARSGRLDSNQRPLDPQSSALTRLRYAPSHPDALRRKGSGAP